MLLRIDVVGFALYVFGILTGISEVAAQEDVSLQGTVKLTRICSFLRRNRSYANAAIPESAQERVALRQVNSRF